MPLKLSKCPQTNLTRSNSSNHSPSHPPPPSNAKFQHTCRFRLHHKLNHPKNSIEESPNKQIVRKYYGKKVVYLENHKDIPAALHRSRLFRSVSLKGGSSGQISLKSKGDQVILANPLCYKEVRSAKSCSRFLMSFNRESPLHPLVLKKFLRTSCQMIGDMRLGLGPLRFMLGLKQISLEVQSRNDVEKLAKMIPAFRSLEAISLRYVDPNYTIASSGGRGSSQNQARWLFSRVNRLPRLKDFRLETSHRTIEGYFSEVQGDLENVLEKKDFKGKTHVKMYFAWDFLGNKKSKALGYFLRDAEALKIDCGGDAAPCKTKEFCSGKRQEKQEKIPQRNTVEILSHFGCKEVNVKEVLSYCQSLEDLYIKSSRDEIAWKSESDLSRNILRLESLKNVEFDFSISKLDSKIPCLEEKRQRSDEMKSHHPLLNMLNFFKENCQAPQSISLSLCVSKIDGQTRLTDFFNEIKENNKIKKFELCTGDKSNLISPQILPLNKNLESFGLYSCPSSEEDKTKENIPSPLELDKMFSSQEEINLKEIHLNTPISSEFLSISSLKRFENLQILEIFNIDSQFMTSAFISNFLIELIEKKHMRKLVICTTDIGRKNDCLQKGSSEILSQQRKIESLLISLKTSNMEEILIGKLKDFPADFLFYNKEFKIERIFWSEEQILMVLRSECKLQKLDSHFLKMIHPVFDTKDVLKKHSM